MAGDEVQEIRKDREQTYGDCQRNHDSVGKMWTGLLEQFYGINLPRELPGHMVALMMAAVKLNRAATPLKFNPDNYLDGKAYIDIAKQVDRRNQP